MLTHLLHPQQTHAGQADPQQSKIGELLVQENLITPLDCKRVLDIQQKEKDYTDLSFLRILEESGRLSEKKRNRLLALPDIQEVIAETSSSHDLCTNEQLKICLEAKNAYQTLPEALVAQNILSADQVDRLIYELLDDEILCRQAGTMGLISEADIDFAYKVAKGPRNFGEICCSLDLVTPLDLYHLLEKHGKQIKFGEILIQLGYTDEKKVNKALEEQKLNNQLLGDILISQKIITSEQCQEALSLQANIPFEPLDDFNYDDFSRDSLPRLISARYAEEHLLLPISILNRSLKLALMQPEAIESARELMSLYKQLQVQCILIPEQRFFELFEELYSETASFQVRKTLLDLKERQQTKEAAVPDFMHINLDENLDIDPVPDHLTDGVEGTDVEEAIHYIVRYGIDQNASDIHLEQGLQGITLRYRIDGVIKGHGPEWLQRFLHENSGSLISRLKVMANLDINEKRLPQDGVFRISYLDKSSKRKSRLEFRVASCPSVTGESITIHILDPRKAKLSLRQNGHSPHVLEPFARCLNRDASIVLVSGPNGSGKSSTLYGALKLIFDPSLKIIAAEDPIEYNFPGIIQTQVNHKLGLDFAQLLRSFLRLDPDIILVGELRDKATAAMAFDAAQTGHLVLSSLYANDSISSLGRLIDLGVDRSQLAASLSCILGQRLVRKICPSCLSEYQPEPKEWSLIFNKYPAHLQFFKGSGCESCGFTGFKGRTVLSEIFTMDTPHEFVSGMAITELKELSIIRGMKTMVHDGLLKMSSTTLTELSRVLPFEMLQSYRRHESQTVSQHLPESRSFLVCDPDREVSTLEEMFNHFNRLVMKSGETSADLKGFSHFISTHFQKFCSEHQCSKVLFTLLHNELGKVEIRAQAEGRE
ncbi:MAG: ATPase, T2SS/T4P/T4SS family [Thermodesulfobacteriota bacterium]